MVFLISHVLPAPRDSYLQDVGAAGLSLRDRSRDKPRSYRFGEN